MEQGFTNWWRLGPAMKNLFAYIFVYLIFAHYFYLLMNTFYLSHNFYCAFVYVSTTWLLEFHVKVQVSSMYDYEQHIKTTCILPYFNYHGTLWLDCRSRCPIRRD
jgi:hypothetical protein